jgi:hypothetical protein
MGRNRLPTSSLVLNGSIDRNPKRYANRTTEPKPTGVLGPAPKQFDKGLKAIWQEFAKQVPAGVLTIADRGVFELTCRLIVKMRAGTISTGEGSQLISCLSRMGMTPSDRSKVSVAPGFADPLVAPSPFAKFLTQ